MVKALILEYLSIKPTHGYEIQKYIQATGFDKWAKIKAGSIYYALGKMEKSGEILLVREETKGSRVRRIYEITEKGIKELENSLKSELKKFLVPIGTDKFLLPMFLGSIDKKEAIKLIESHVKMLVKEQEYWEYWMGIKVEGNTSKVEAISFEMTLSNIKNSIRWHEALINEFDEYVEQSKKQRQIIKNFNFDEYEGKENNSDAIDEKRVSELKNIILNNPEESKEALEELLNLLNSK